VGCIFAELRNPACAVDDDAVIDELGRWRAASWAFYPLPRSFEHSPPYDPAKPLERDQEAEIRAHYGTPATGPARQHRPKGDWVRACLNGSKSFYTLPSATLLAANVVGEGTST
jgi:hypothetical protein